MIAILSAGPAILSDVIVDPWKRVGRDWPTVPVKFEKLEGIRWAVTRWTAAGPLEVVIDPRLTQVERRVAIAHECEHLDRGAPCGTLRATIEHRVIVDTARYLLPDLDRVAEALAVYDLHRAAAELWVTFPVLVDRIKAFSDLELEYVTARREAVA